MRAVVASWKHFTAASISILLASCQSTTNFWYRQNVAPSAPKTEEIDCRVSAAQRVPVSTHVAQNPAYRVPVTTTCYNSGGTYSCYQSGGQVYGGDVYSYDANASLRKEVMNQCMAQKGYRLITLRSCEDADLKRGLPSYQLLPPLNANSCAHQVPSGGYVFITP